jgi:hypothetical protein
MNALSTFASELRARNECVLGNALRIPGDSKKPGTFVERALHYPEYNKAESMRSEWSSGIEYSERLHRGDPVSKAHCIGKAAATLSPVLAYPG